MAIPQIAFSLCAAVKQPAKCEMEEIKILGEVSGRCVLEGLSLPNGVGFSPPWL